MKHVYLLFFLFFGLTVKSQDSLTLLSSISIKANLFTTDPLGNIYLVTTSNSLIRYNSQGDSIGFFNEIKKGKITQIDATNPLRILLYFSEYNQIVVLDRLLTFKSSLKLNQAGIFNVECIANSADGEIWIFEPVSGVLLKIDDKLTIKSTTTLKNIVEQNLNPCYLIEQDRNLFMIDSLAGIKRFDQYGFYKTSYNFYTKEAQFFNDYLVYFKTPYLYSYHTKVMTENKLLLPHPEDILQTRIERNRLYVLRPDKLDIYTLSPSE